MDTKRCKSIDVMISGMDGSESHGGVRRSRGTEVTTSGSGKRRRRFDPRDQESVELKIQCRSGVDVNFMEDVVSSTESGSCDRALSPKQELSLDLKAELRFETETSMSSNDDFSRETSSSSEICLDSEYMESSSTLKNKTAAPQATISRPKPATASITPMAAEIEEFFSAAEKKDKERFTDKYNYDIVNDVPMEGRYQWVRLKP
ncbi:cyclin-dependent kinase inhibitor 7-like [Cynara cardunculus var. scolymus]|uniref:cyclin-dependent kinase inhibitor 7-like n=1 Tax=Cynara cardunculus var. scolymus TaxID=59895 RepID=UPI000D62B09E|nr:cyclin-dependent kinase inhibitor 7-like [Cynara cardunculus var. scolymus]XP_024980315.1 cyclin-dependent kinase inhibitor 7-like [Cynara cardunculus var. scolymus]